MSINLWKDRGTSLEKQTFTWRDLVQKPMSKLNDDAFTRIRVILMNSIELEANRFSHACARFNKDLQFPLGKVRRVEQHQATLISGLIGADLSPLETSVAYEQVAIEVTGAVAQKETDPYLAQVYRFGLLEDFDHLYRFAGLMDRLEGKDANIVLQNYTDIITGRPTTLEHRDPVDDLRHHYDKLNTDPLSKFHAVTILAEEQQTHNFYMQVGPMFADPTARQLYAEIASIEEQHVTQYESIIDPSETWLEKLLIHEATEVYNYASCLAHETAPRVRAIWERFLDYELGHLDVARELFKRFEERDPEEILPERLPDLLEYRSQRDFVRYVLDSEVDLQVRGSDFVRGEEGKESQNYRERMNSEGSPSELVSGGYIWRPGTELTI